MIKSIVSNIVRLWTTQKAICLVLLCILMQGKFSLNLQAQSTVNSIHATSIGIQFEGKVIDGSFTIVVSKILPNSAASSTDIQLGDYLILLNGIQVEQTKESLEKINSDMLSGKQQVVNLDLERHENRKSIKRITYTLDIDVEPKPAAVKKYGIGVTLIVDTIRMNSTSIAAAVVDKVYPGSPAEKADIRQGDFIIEVDGHVMNNKEASVTAQVVDWLLIDEARLAKLMILRNVNSIYTTMPFSIMREDISRYVQKGNATFPNLMIDHHPEENIPVKLKPSEHDKDGDGIDDRDDACPDEPGVESNSPFDNGCPLQKE